MINEVEITCPKCNHTFWDYPVTGSEESAIGGSAKCPKCEEVFNVNLDGSQPDESMDGDHDSSMRDAGMGTDEDYGPGASEII